MMNTAGTGPDRLGRERALLQQLFGGSSLHLILFCDGIAVYTSEAAEALLGIRPGDDMLDYIARDDLTPTETRHILAFGRDGRRHRIFANISHFPLPDGDGRVLWFVNSALDHEQEQVLLRERLLAERRSKVKSEYLADMSHEIRTPLNVIVGFANLLLNEASADKESAYLRKMIDAANTLLTVINNVLDFSKMEIGKMNLETLPFRLSRIVERMDAQIGEMAREKGVAFSITMETDVNREIYGDPLRLEQLLLNLLTNAVQYTSEGAICLHVAERTVTDSDIELLFKVEDTGIGMSARQIELLFAPLAETDIMINRKYGGSGLGIAISRNLVALMKGEFWCESAVDEGTRFYFTAHFSLHSEEDTASAPSVRPVRYDDSDFERNARVRILVAEDIDINRTIIDELLKLRGYRASFAVNGDEAVQMVRETPYDIVFMDIRMPGRDGLSAAAELRRDPRFTRLPIIALTAQAMTGDREKSIEAGMNEHLTKPIDPELLYQTLRCWVTASVSGDDQ